MKDFWTRIGWSITPDESAERANLARESWRAPDSDDEDDDDPQ